jgi:dolichyl-phosphate beta-glucosyltransferase
MTAFLGIVVPVYNEDQRLNFHYFSSIAALPNVSLVFVDDASTDSSLELIKAFSDGERNVSFLSLGENVGKANAIRSGWIHLQNSLSCDFLGFLDADGAFCLEDVRNLTNKVLGPQTDIRFVESMKGAEFPNAYWSSRIGLSGRHINRSRSRYILGRILANLIRVFHKGLPWDTQSGFKIFRNEEVFISSIQPHFKCRWLFDIELLLRMRRKESRYIVWEEPLFQWEDVPGSKVSLKGYLQIIKDFFYLLTRFKFEGNCYE